MAASLGIPTGALPTDTGEFLLGRVAVTPIFLESDGSIDTESQNWTTQEIEDVLEKVTRGVNWWTEALDQLGSVHTLEFVVDDTYARNPVEIGYEPIDRPSDDYDEYVGDFLDFVGISSSHTLQSGMLAFNHAQRERLGTDWAFSILIADSSDDADGFFPSNGSFRGAFAFAGGQFFVTTSTRPISTFTHEMGHIFWGMDEYAGGGTYHSSRGYYDTPNENAYDNPTVGFVQQDSIMADFNRLVAAYASHESPASTFAQLGWQDSDGDGIFDVLDVPLSLEGTGVLDDTTGQFHLIAEASVNTLPNRNSSGSQSDITLNRVSRLEMSIDGGDWQVVAEPNTPIASFDLLIDVPESFAAIDFRVIDAPTGVTSPVLSATMTTPLMNASPLVGFNYIDNDRNGVRSAGEPLLESTVIDVKQVGGGDLPNGELRADSLPMQSDLTTFNGITLRGKTPAADEMLQVRNYGGGGGQPLFHVYDRQMMFYTPIMNNRLRFEAVFDEPTSYVEVDVVALGGVASYGRVDAFDADGNLVGRVTTDVRNHPTGSLSVGEQHTLVLHDQLNRIASIEVYGHDETVIGTRAIRYGVPPSFSTDQFGAFSLAGLPDGQYEITATPSDPGYLIEPQTVTVSSGEIVGGVSGFQARPVFSPRFNQTQAEDVNGDNVVTAVDALQIINDLNLNGSRPLAWDDADGAMVDVTNDGVVTALDALRVINRLNAQDAGGSSGGQAQSEPLAVDAEDDERKVLTDSTPSTTIDEVFSQTQKWVAAPGDAFDDGGIRFT
ncbi:Dockerin type I repeat protein [Neorhodopirellula pilleata]|uniref:Dockerin type I repeat protein n=2 Tax=Neorhodopirellula pilleata TaxID=2714738 RepID=A0A5C6AUI2_9BACT|nr:Dockerin type I repeat protein [Neorhodopirellula pilleata]